MKLLQIMAVCRRARVWRCAPALAWLVPAVTILLTVGWLGLISPTETRYAEIAREMVMNGDWLIPRIEGTPHLDKPPLAYWAFAAGHDQPPPASAGR